MYKQLRTFVVFDGGAVDVFAGRRGSDAKKFPPVVARNRVAESQGLSLTLLFSLLLVDTAQAQVMSGLWNEWALLPFLNGKAASPNTRVSPSVHNYR